MENVHIFDTLEQFNMACAAAIAEHLCSVCATQATCHIALAGGNTPRAVYHCLSAPEMQSRIPWAQVHIWFGDERCVPPTHAESNYRMARETLLTHVPVVPLQIHRIAGELDPELAAQRYAKEIRRDLPSAQGKPRLDLILLGMGSDGHTASLFPATPILQETKQYAATVHLPTLDSWRVSLTLPVINSARHIMCLVTGRNKSAVIGRILGRSEETADAARYPIQHIQPTRGTLHWYLDREAAAELPR